MDPNASGHAAESRRGVGAAHARPDQPFRNSRRRSSISASASAQEFKPAGRIEKERYVYGLPVLVKKGSKFSKLNLVPGGWQLWIVEVNGARPFLFGDRDQPNPTIVDKARSCTRVHDALSSEKSNLDLTIVVRRQGNARGILVRITLQDWDQSFEYIWRKWMQDPRQIILPLATTDVGAEPFTARVDYTEAERLAEVAEYELRKKEEADERARIDRERAAVDLPPITDKEFEVVMARELNAWTEWSERLDVHLAFHIAAAGPARYLGQQLERPLAGPEIRLVQAQVGVNDPHQGDVGKMEALGDHLRADQDVDLAGAKIPQDPPVILLALHQVGVHPLHAGVGEEPVQRVLDLLQAIVIVGNPPADTLIFQAEVAVQPVRRSARTNALEIFGVRPHHRVLDVLDDLVP